MPGGVCPIEASELGKRQELIATCNDLAGRPVAFDAAQFSATLTAETPMRGLVGIYSRMGQFGYESFRQGLNADQQAALSSPGIPHGFRVVERLISASVPAYQQYCAEQQTSPSIEQLKQALHRSKQTPNSFLGLPDLINHALEEAFLLEDDWGIVSPKFKFDNTPAGLSFLADKAFFAEHLEYAISNFGRAFDERELPMPYRRCPARRLVLKQIWPAMINLAADTPEVFARDLGLEDDTKTARPATP